MMKRIGMVLGVAAVATLAGCKDPNYNSTTESSQTEVKSAAAVDVGATEKRNTTPPPPPPVAEVPVKKCSCPPGAVHDRPCACGASDCRCKVAAPEQETTIYIVQSGDYLAKISKKFNVRIDAIRKLNPSIKKDVIRVGQKIKLPGKIDVGVQKAAPAAKSVTAKKFTPYTGATVDYVVKSGDTLGKLAYSNGITIRQLKDLNGMKNDSLKVGKTIKIPATKVTKAAKAAAEKAPAKTDAAPAAVPAEPVAAPAAPAAEAAAPAPAAETAAAPAAEAAAPAAEAPAASYEVHVVEKGEDLLGVAVRWNVSPAAIRELNNLPEDAKLVPGQKLKLPPEASQQQ